MQTPEQPDTRARRGGSVTPLIRGDYIEGAIVIVKCENDTGSDGPEYVWREGVIRRRERCFSPAERKQGAKAAELTVREAGAVGVRALLAVAAARSHGRTESQQRHSMAANLVRLTRRSSSRAIKGHASATAGSPSRSQPVPVHVAPLRQHILAQWPAWAATVWLWTRRAALMSRPGKARSLSPPAPAWQLLSVSHFLGQSRLSQTAP